VKFANTPTCPHCGHIHAEDVMNGAEEMENRALACTGCGKAFRVRFSVIRSYVMERERCAPGAHIFRPTRTHVSQLTCDAWNEEAFCDRQDWQPHDIHQRECICCDLRQSATSAPDADPLWPATDKLPDAVPLF
jgi:hypothetical protein